MVAWNTRWPGIQRQCCVHQPRNPGAPHTRQDLPRDLQRGQPTDTSVPEQRGTCSCSKPRSELRGTRLSASSLCIHANDASVPSSDQGSQGALREMSTWTGRPLSRGERNLSFLYEELGSRTPWRCLAPVSASVQRSLEREGCRTNVGSDSVFLVAS